MTDVFVAIAVAIVAVLAQDVLPGRALYHYGWYNAIVAALTIYAISRLRGVRRAHPRATGAFAVLLFGTGVVVFAGIAGGLLAPDTQTLVGAPGASVRSADLGGTLAFPLAPSDPIALERGRSTILIGGGRRYTGGFVLWKVPRSVVYVEAQDAGGNRLTITQPSNATFLSPVLLLQQTTHIAGMTVPVDTFAVPAARRVVKAVLFSAQQAAQLHTTPPIVGSPAVLFAVSDQNDRILPGGIGVLATGQRRALAGLRLRGDVRTYPAITVASAPYLPVLVIGLALALAGAGRLRMVVRADITASKP
ncbi:MAG TPA: hypothetical protein VIG51_08645 [Candidatus Baltobacteraceae bacterium]